MYIHYFWRKSAFLDAKTRAFPECRIRRRIPVNLALKLKAAAPRRYSHSIVPGGLLVTSYTTRLIPRTSLMIRVATRAKNA